MYTNTPETPSGYISADDYEADKSEQSTPANDDTPDVNSIISISNTSDDSSQGSTEHLSSAVSFIINIC